MSDASSTSLFVMLRGVLFDEAEQSAYRADPGGYLAAHGYDGLDHDDVAEAMTLLADSLPADQAAMLTSGADGGFGSPAAPAPPSDLAPVDQAVLTINHYVDTVREAPEPGLGDGDPGPGDLAVLDGAEAGALADDHVASFDALADDGLDGFDGLDEADGLDGVDDLDGLGGPAGGADLAVDLAVDLDDQLAAFAAPDVLVHGDPVDALLEEGDLAVAFDAAPIDGGAFDLGDDPADVAPDLDDVLPDVAGLDAADVAADEDDVDGFE
jgi:hypothetical protein